MPCPGIYEPEAQRLSRARPLSPQPGGSSMLPLWSSVSSLWLLDTRFGKAVCGSMSHTSPCARPLGWNSVSLPPAHPSITATWQCPAHQQSFPQASHALPEGLKGLAEIPTLRGFNGWHQSGPAGWAAGSHSPAELRDCNCIKSFWRGRKLAAHISPIPAPTLPSLSPLSDLPAYNSEVGLLLSSNNPNIVIK